MLFASCPFGMLMPGRKYSAQSNYRYGFNGKENDNEVKGEGNNINFGNRIYDPRLGRWLSVDPLQQKYPYLSPYNAFENNPIYFADPDGKDAIVTIKNNTITVSATIYIYGKDATAAIATKMQSSINNKWNNLRPDGKHENFKYKDNATGKEYAVIFDVKVKVYGGKEHNDISSNDIPETREGRDRDNFIKIDNSTVRSNVVDGDEGTWNGSATSRPEDHEFGHLLGLSDRYDDIIDRKTGKRIGSQPHEGWGGNIMGQEVGIVEQKNIDEIVKEHVDKFNANIQRAKDVQKAKKLLKETALNVQMGSGQGLPGLYPLAYGDDKIPTEYKGEINKAGKPPGIIYKQ